MTVQLPSYSEQKRRALVAVLMFAIAVPSTLLQAQPAPQGPPPPAGERPPALPDGPLAGPGGVTAQLGPPPPPPLTPAQKIVAALPPPEGGGLPPRPPLPADAPLPSSDPRDLQGTWVHNRPLEHRAQNDMYGAPAPYTMEGAKVIARRVKSLKDGKPFLNASAICRPPGPQWHTDLNFPFQIMQTKDNIEIVYEEYHGRWNITLDPQRLPLPPGKQYMGRSVAHWDGNTLVVMTDGFKQGLWIDVDGTPLSANGKLVQRIRKVDDGGHVPFIEIVTTIIDPLYYTKPWSIVRTYGWYPYAALFAEYNCEEQVGDQSVRADAGLVAEPQD